jgi:hypothetical protein
MFYLGDTLMTKKMTKGALFVEKLKGDEKLQGELKKDPSAVLKKFGFNVDDLPGEVAMLFAGAGNEAVRRQLTSAVNHAPSWTRTVSAKPTKIEPWRPR